VLAKNAFGKACCFALKISACTLGNKSAGVFYLKTPVIK